MLQPGPGPGVQSRARAGGQARLLQAGHRGVGGGLRPGQAQELVGEALPGEVLHGAGEDLGLPGAGVAHQLGDRQGRGGAAAEDLDEALMEGAVLRVRPKAMTAAVILAGLFPLMIGEGAGSEIMQRLAAPMVGGMITAPLLSLFVLPAIYKLLGVRQFVREEPRSETVEASGTTVASRSGA